MQAQPSGKLCHPPPPVTAKDVPIRGARVRYCKCGSATGGLPGKDKVTGHADSVNQCRGSHPRQLARRTDRLPQSGQDSPPAHLHQNFQGMSAPLIAHIVHRLDFGGLENGLVNLINGLPNDLYRHVIICMTVSTDFRHRIRRPDVAIHELHKVPGKDPAAYFRLWKLLRHLRPDAVHTMNTGVIDCQVIARLSGVRRRIHGYHGWDMDDIDGSNARRNRLRRICDPCIDHYVAVSRQIATWLTTTLSVDPDRVTTICNGVDVERFSPRSAAQTLHEPRRLVIGTVGRLQTVKNQGLLVEACGLLLRQRPDLADNWELLVVGDGPERQALQRRIEVEGLAGQAAIAGFRNDVPSALREIDVFVLPSLNEGISNTILEAMATGLPVIATGVGGSPELVKENETGFLIPSGDPAALAERLLRYLESPALLRAHGRAARDHAEHRFSIQRMLADYARMYDAVL